MTSKRSLLAVPYVGWMALFVVAPIIMVVIYAFTSAGASSAEIGNFTIDNFTGMGTYLSIFLRSFQLALVATAICLLIGYPLAYVMAKEGPDFQKIAMVLIMLPMWVNFLLRTYAWMAILENNGLLNQLFSAVGIIDLGNAVNGALNDLCAALNGSVVEWINGLLGTDWVLDTARDTSMDHFRMIRTQGAVVLGMVYNYLPFMVLPIYSVIIKLDHSLLEAAQDLGASSAGVFRRVIFPLSLPGILSGVTMVFVPSVSTFAISQLLGGGTHMLLGNLIELQFLGGAYNPHLGSAIALVMMIIVIICMWVMNRFGEGEEQAVVL